MSFFDISMFSKTIQGASMKRWRLKIKIKRAFLRISGPDQLIDYSDWKKALAVRSDFLANRLFQLIDSDNSGYIDLSEFTSFIETLTLKPNTEKLKFVFKCYDVDDDNKLTKGELHSLLKTSLSEQQLQLTEEKLSEMVDSVLEAAQVSKNSLNESDFLKLFSFYPQLNEQIDTFIKQLLEDNPKAKLNKAFSAPYIKRYLIWLQSYFALYVWLIAYVTANAYFFTHAMAIYNDLGANLYIQIARGAGACLNFNAALLLVPLCRCLFSYTRKTFLKRVLPLNNLKQIHKFLAIVTVYFSIIHIVAHLVNIISNNQRLTELLLYSSIGITGLILTFCLLLMWNSYQHRHRLFERFEIMHYLYAPFLVALLLHGSSIWLWILPSTVLFLIEAILRSFTRYTKAEITELNALSNRVTQAKFKRGRLFKFTPGDYIRVKIPEISRWQWHPFTLSAAPETDRVDIHVRHAGNWTAALHNLASKTHPKNKKWLAYIDGPYAAPTSEIQHSNVAILIAGGIGVTPFASVIHSLLKSSKDKPTALYFHWLNRSQQSYSWFINLIDLAEKKLGSEKFVAFLHLTQLALNLSNLLLQIAFDAYWKKHGQDVLTDLKAQTLAGRPNWNQYFGNVEKTHPNTTIDVFYCGPKKLGKQIRQESFRMGYTFHEEKFD
jgi:predicted ferric reductase/Ca2+-binding EF-hand superfamily protein